jgi:hypothetical protein
VPVGLGLPVPFVVVVESVLDGVPVVDRLPPVGAEVMVGVVTVVCAAVSVVALAPLDSLPEVLVVEGAAVLEEEVPSALALMAKGKEYWNIVGSDSRVMRMPYVAALPRVLSTVHEYWPAALSTLSVRRWSVSFSCVASLGLVVSGSGGTTHLRGLRRVAGRPGWDRRGGRLSRGRSSWCWAPTRSRTLSRRGPRHPCSALI